MIVGITVQAISRRVLPWIGSPAGLSPRLGFELEEGVEEHHHHQREDERRDDDHHVEEIVDLRRGGGGLLTVPVDRDHHRGHDDRQRDRRQQHLHYGQAAVHWGGGHSIEAAAGGFAGLR